jgi:hypothetical protein
MGTRSLILAIGIAVALPAAAIPEPANLSPLLRAPANETPAFVLNGNGVYIYQCRQSLLNANAYEWAFVVPDATLYEGARTVARHATVGLYESLSDTSSLSGVVRTSQAAGQQNLPWVLMRAQPLADSGLFAGVTSVQRVNTVGGAAPVSGCNSDNVGEEAHVAYRADYYFYRPRGAT